MATTFTLDNLRADLEAKYGPVVLEGFPDEGGPIRLLPMLRHTAARRDEISALMKRHAEGARAREVAEKAADPEAEVDSTDLNRSVAQIEELVTLVLERKDDIERIKTAFAGDGQALMLLWEAYLEVTQPGEAGPSEN